MRSEHSDILATKSAWKGSAARAERLAGLYSLLGLLAVPALMVPSSIVASRFVDGFAQILLSAGLMVAISVPVVYVMWQAGRKQSTQTVELMDGLEQQLNAALDEARIAAQRRDVQASRQAFEARLANALEMAEGETEVIAVVERAFASTLPDAAAELLLADNSHAHLSRMAVSGTAPEEMCNVASPDHCPAARRAQVQRFPDSDALDACPKLRSRSHGRTSALCVPVSIMGRTVGVIHSTAEPLVDVDDETIQDVSTLANLAGARLGLLRMVADTQLQAATDSLTGLLNRRSLENRVRGLRGSFAGSSVVMADLDRFKALNDTFGHDTGDRALRLYAQTLETSLRASDLVSRYGGEEFAIVLTACSAVDALQMLDQVRSAVAAAVAAAGLPEITASFGVVETLHDEDLPSALARADAALFEAKRSGRDRIVVHDASGQPMGAIPEGPPSREPAATAALGARPRPQAGRLSPPDRETCTPEPAVVST